MIITCEIANPSDMAHIRGTRNGILGAVFAIGEGMYAAIDISSDETVAPMFPFGGFEAWALLQWGHDDLEVFLDEHADEVIAALDSVRLGGPEALDEDGDRQALKEARRSSMNDIAGRAWRYAEILRARQAERNTRP